MQGNGNCQNFSRSAAAFGVDKICRLRVLVVETGVCSLTVMQHGPKYSVIVSILSAFNQIISRIPLVQCGMKMTAQQTFNSADSKV